MQEMKDFNQYSQHDELLPRGGNPHGGGRPRGGYHGDYPEEDPDEMMYVTTL